MANIKFLQQELPLYPTSIYIKRSITRAYIVRVLSEDNRFNGLSKKEQGHIRKTVLSFSSPRAYFNPSDKCDGMVFKFLHKICDRYYKEFGYKPYQELR